MISIIFYYIESITKIFIDHFTIYVDSFDNCLSNLTFILKRYVETNLVLIWKKSHFMVDQGIILGYMISFKGIKVDKYKVYLVRSLPPSTCGREAHSFFSHVGFYRIF